MVRHLVRGGSRKRTALSYAYAARQAEADSYWCLSTLLDAIQDHYTFAQPGIQRMVFKLSHLVKRIDAPLAPVGRGGVSGSPATRAGTPRRGP